MSVFLEFTYEYTKILLNTSIKKYKNYWNVFTAYNLIDPLYHIQYIGTDKQVTMALDTGLYMVLEMSMNSSSVKFIEIPQTMHV